MGLIIYSVIQTRNPKLLIDVILCDIFTPYSIKLTNRAYYMTVVYSAFEFLEGISEERIKELQEKALERIKIEKEEGVYIIENNELDPDSKDFQINLTKSESMKVLRDKNKREERKNIENSTIIEDEFELLTKDIIETKTRSF